MTAAAVFSTGPFSLAGGGPASENVTAVGLWESSDPTVATVTNGTGADISYPTDPSGGFLFVPNWGTGGGLVNAVGRGNCTITFFCGQVSGSFTVSVA
jgi:hypothetical protein